MRTHFLLIPVLFAAGARGQAPAARDFEAELLETTYCVNTDRTVDITHHHARSRGAAGLRAGAGAIAGA
jgi:hypothetical protein